jgi:hypothetical protein
VAVKGNIFGISRKLLSSDEWLGETFTKGQAWVDLVGLARWQDGHVMFGTTRIDLNRGQLAWSVKNLAKRWGWSRGKAVRQLSVWEAKQQVIQAGNRITTVITITNYDQYQFGDTTYDTTPDTTPDTTGDTLKNTEKNINTEKSKKDGRKKWLQDQLTKAWKEHCPSMQPLSIMWSEVRWHHVRSLFSKLADVKSFTLALKKFEASDKLTGRDASHRGTYGFDWLIQEDNYVKVVEGVFENKGKRTSRTTRESMDKQMLYQDEQILREIILEFPSHETSMLKFISGDMPLPAEIEKRIKEKKNATR